MAKLNLKRPSEEVVEQANKVTYVTDARGRRIGLKKPGILAQYRLVEMLGDSARNEAFMGMILPVTFVVQIDDDEVPFPRTRRELDALIQRIDEDGLLAIQQGLVGMVIPGSGTEVADQLKNS